MDQLDGTGKGHGAAPLATGTVRGAQLGGNSLQPDNTEQARAAATVAAFDAVDAACGSLADDFPAF